MAANTNLLGNADDAALSRNDESAGMLMESGRSEVTRTMTPRAAAAVPETRRAEQAALLRPKITASPLQGPH